MITYKLLMYRNYQECKIFFCDSNSNLINCLLFSFQFEKLIYFSFASTETATVNALKALKCIFRKDDTVYVYWDSKLLAPVVFFDPV